MRIRNSFFIRAIFTRTIRYNEILITTRRLKVHGNTKDFLAFKKCIFALKYLIIRINSKYMEQWGNNGSALKEKWIHYKKCFNCNKKKVKLKLNFSSMTDLLTFSIYK